MTIGYDEFPDEGAEKHLLPEGRWQGHPDRSEGSSLESGGASVRAWKRARIVLTS